MERHPSEMTPAELRCLRESLGLTVRAMSAAVGQTYQTVTRWESGERRISPRSAAALADLVGYTDAFVDGLVRVHRAGRPLVTYLTDDDLRAHVDTGGRVLSAAWHRASAWRAAGRVPGARVVYAE